MQAASKLDFFNFASDLKKSSREENSRAIIYVSDVIKKSIKKAAQAAHNTMTRKFIFMEGDASSQIASFISIFTGISYAWPVVEGSLLFAADNRNLSANVE